MSRAPTLREIKALGYDWWKKQPVLDQGHFDNLVYDDGRYRVWVSRQGPGDYDSRRDWLEDRFTIEENRRGRWVRV